MNIYLSLLMFTLIVNSAESTTTSCPNLWIPFEGNCYMFGTGHTTFIEAEHTCRQHNSHLVEIHNSYENAFLKEELRRLGPKCAWIGMKDDIEGVWLWESNGAHIGLSDFYPGQDNDDQDCGVFWKNYNYRWGDYQCHYTCIPLCKQSGANSVAVIG